MISQETIDEVKRIAEHECSPFTTPPEEDDLRAAREAAAQTLRTALIFDLAEAVESKEYDNLTQVQSALLALRNARRRCEPVAVPALDEFAKHRNWELSCGEDPYMEGEMRWHVHSVNGGRNDREWTLIGFGDTPEEAICSALETVAVKEGGQ